MALFEWRPEFNVGIEAIDTDHKFLVSLINQLDEANTDGQGKEIIGSVLNALYDYTEFHFAREEKMMSACGYPDLERHGQQHHALKARLMEIRDDYLASQSNNIEASVLEFLKDWLSEHILGRDMQYVSCMESNAEAVEAAARTFDENRDWMLVESDIE
ncbi:MAG: bacteriohemerythrin [Alphaproteobacteria bacterium]